MAVVSYHDTINDLQGLRLSGKGPFARPEWFALLESGGARPVYATAASPEGALTLPLMEHDRALAPLTNWYAFTWREMRSGQPDRSLYRDLARSLAKRTHRVELAKLPDEEGIANQLADAFSNEGWLVFPERCDSNHALEINGRNFAEYLSGRPGQLRTTLKRKARKVRVSLSRRFKADDWSIYEDIYARSWKPAEGDPALLRRFAEGESDVGHYLFGKALVDEKPVAAQFWTVEDGTAYIHKLAHLESAARLSPGTTLTAALFEDVIDRDRVDWIDFGTGDDGYKTDWMEQVRPRWRLICMRPSDPRNWAAMGRAWARKLVSRAPAG